MKKLFLLAVVMLSSVGAFAQNEVGAFSIQPKVGMTIHNTTKCNADAGVGLIAGAELEYQITDLLSVAAGALYSQQGFKDFANDYINVPIVANVYVTKGLAVKAGAQFGFNVNSDFNAEAFDFSIPVGASYEYKHIVLDARYNLGLTNVWKGANPKNSVFQITLGYKFDL